MSAAVINRYPGVRPFADNPNDRRLFFGRDGEIDMLFHRVCAARLLVLFGKSGLGKTSLLQAGVFPKLRERYMLPISVRLNIQDTPLNIIKTSVEKVCRNLAIDYTPGEGETLWEFFKTAMFWQGDLLYTPVLVFDQFEEIFTLKNVEERTVLARELGDLFRGTLPPNVRQRRQSPDTSKKNNAALTTGTALTEQAPNVRVILSLREDFLGALQDIAADIPGIFDDRVRLSPLSNEQAQKAICAPADLDQDAVCGSQFATPRFAYADDTLKEILDYLRGKSEIIEPFQLQLVCCDIEGQVAQQHAKGNPISIVTSNDLGGRKRLDTIARNFYQQTLTKLPWRDRRYAQHLCEEGLLNAEGFRLPLQENEILKNYKLSSQALTALVEARLLRKEPRLESFFYELSHDSLARPIRDSRPWKLTRKQRAFGYGGVVALLIISMFGYWQFQAKLAADKAQAQAQQAREAAEEVLDYLVFDLRDKLEPIGRLDIVEEVQQQVNQYYEKLGVDGQSAAVLNRRGVAYESMGNQFFAQGELEKAQEAYQQYLNLVEQAATLEPDEFTWQGNISVSFNKLGDVLFDQGKLAEALQYYQDSLAIRKILIEQDPGNAWWQRDVSVSFERLGDVLRAQGKLAEAQQYYQDSLAIRKILIEQDPNNARWQRDISILFNKLGDVLRTQGKLAEAQQYYQDSLAIRQKLVEQDPNNARWQRDVSVSFDNLGNVLRAQGKLAEAQQYYQDGLAIMKILIEQDPDNAGWQRDYSVSFNKLGNVLRAQGKLAEALQYYQDSLAIMQKLAAQDPSNTRWQRDLSISHQNVGLVLEAQKEGGKALEAYQQSMTIREKLVSHDPSNATWQSDLTWVYDLMLPLLFELNRFDAAAEIAQRRVAHLLKQDDHQENKQALAEAYLELAWYELFNQKPKMVIAASEQGLQLNVEDATNVLLHTNLAHGYLFIDQYEKAKSIYLNNNDKQISAYRSFKQAVLDDFKAFREHGIIHADMVRIEELLH